MLCCKASNRHRCVFACSTKNTHWVKRLDCGTVFQALAHRQGWALDHLLLLKVPDALGGLLLVEEPLHVVGLVWRRCCFAGAAGVVVRLWCFAVCAERVVEVLVVGVMC